VIKSKEFLAALSIMFFLIGACSSEPAINKNKFAKVKAAALSIKTALAAGASYQESTDRVEHLSVEINELKDKVTTKQEEVLLNAYSDLLGFYRDGLLLWKCKLEFAFFDFVLKGRIYVSQDIEPIVWKYQLSTETHLYAPTHQYWKSIDEDSIRLIWSNADSQLKIIENITNYGEK
jgi:hypothetical protein